MIKDLKKLYDDWNKKNIKLEKFKDFIEIQTPFVDMHNDFIHLFFSEIDNKYTISDDGHVLSELNMLGVDVSNTKKRKDYFNTKLRIFGVNFNEKTEELYVSFDDLSEYPQKQHNLIQCIIQVSDMLLTSRSNVISIFTEEIKRFFDESDILNTPDLGFNGKSGNQQNFDFVIPHRKEKKEKIIKAVNSPTSRNYQNTLFPFIDIQDVRSDSEFYVLANDINVPVSDKFSNSLNNYGIKVLPWSDKNQIVNTLKVI